MKYEMAHYRHNDAMWRKIDSIINETTPETMQAFTSMMGFTKTVYGSFWKLEAYNEAVEITIIEE